MTRLVTVIASFALAALVLGTVGSRAETSEGTFVVRCDPSHTRAADPIVLPGFFPSAHEHQFFGNKTTDENSTYASMTAGTSTCKDTLDTAGYWVPTLYDDSAAPSFPVLSPSPGLVVPRFSFAYYKSEPNAYQMTQPFPPDFRMIAGGLVNPSATSWDCFRTKGGPLSAPPYCTGTGNWLQLKVAFPNCWDGVNLDSADHRSHVVYPVKNPSVKGQKMCPADHPVKLPFVNFFVQYPDGSCPTGCHFSDGTTVAHADFWNTWQQSALEGLVQRCLNAGINCGQVTK